MLAALTHGDLVHIVEPHRGTVRDVYAIACGGYALVAVFGESTFPTCVACAAGYDYWREDVR